MFKKREKKSCLIFFAIYCHDFCLVQDMMKLQRAKEQNDRLDVEIRALRERVCTVEREKKNLLDQVSILLN